MKDMKAELRSVYKANQDNYYWAINPHASKPYNKFHGPEPLKFLTWWAHRAILMHISTIEAKK